MGPQSHPLSAILATSLRQSHPLRDPTMRHGRWKSVQIARRYIRQGTRWDDNPAADLGL
jgi:hypothetical protein